LRSPDGAGTKAGASADDEGAALKKDMAGRAGEERGWKTDEKGWARRGRCGEVEGVTRRSEVEVGGERPRSGSGARGR
jgi:hypothetical protein